MTRKDYILLASALRDARLRAEANQSPEMKLGVSIAVDAVAAALASDNPRFDRARFDTAIAK